MFPSHLSERVCFIRTESLIKNGDCPCDVKLANKWTTLHCLLLMNVAGERHFTEDIPLIGQTEVRDFLLSIGSTCACWLQTAGTGELYSDFSSPPKTRKDDLMGCCKEGCAWNIASCSQVKKRRRWNCHENDEIVVIDFTIDCHFENLGVASAWHFIKIMTFRFLCQFCFVVSDTSKVKETNGHCTPGLPPKKSQGDSHNAVDKDGKSKLSCQLDEPYGFPGDHQSGATMLLCTCLMLLFYCCVQVWCLCRNERHL